MNQALITAESYSGDRLSRLKDVLRGLDALLREVRISSVFETSPEIANEDRPVRGSWFPEREWGAFTVAVTGKFEESPVLFFRKLKGLEDLLNRTSKSVDLDLVMVEGVLTMTPELTLPHPEFHLRPHLIIPAAEVAGSWKHPVLDMKVAELIESFPKRNWGRYQAPGRSLLESGE